MALHVDITVRKMFVLCYKFVQRDYEVFVRFSEINQSTQIPTSHLLYETLGPIYEQKSKSPTSCGKVRQTLIFFWQCIFRTLGSWQFQQNYFGRDRTINKNKVSMLTFFTLYVCSSVCPSEHLLSMFVCPNICPCAWT